MILGHFAPPTPTTRQLRVGVPSAMSLGGSKTHGPSVCGSPCGRDSRVSASSYAQAGARPSGSRCRIFFFPQPLSINPAWGPPWGKGYEEQRPLAVKGPATGESSSPSPTRRKT